MNILAIDQATVAGWKTSTASGTWNLKTKADESMGIKLIRFKAKIKEICKLEDIGIIVYERAASQYKASLIHGSKLIAIIELFCEENKLECKAYSANEIKMFATGNGNAGKPAMIQACIDKYNITPADDNEADAVHIYYLAKTDLGL